VAVALPPPEDAGPLAAAFEAALDSGDAAGALALFAPDAQVKERVAVLAAGPERVAAWVRGCLLPDIRIVPGTRRVDGAGAAWVMWDALGCYRRARPDTFTPAWDVAPADGTLAVAVAGGRISTLTIAYDPAWERRKLEAQAAPVRTAQARATQAAAAATAGAAAIATRGVEATHAADARLPKAPNTQDRRTPSVGPWLVALGLTLAGVLGLALLTLLTRPGEAP
jgi:hypothetical protein